MNTLSSTSKADLGIDGSAYKNYATMIGNTNLSTSKKLHSNKHSYYKLSRPEFKSIDTNHTVNNNHYNTETVSAANQAGLIPQLSNEMKQDKRDLMTQYFLSKKKMSKTKLNA